MQQLNFKLKYVEHTQFFLQRLFFSGINAVELFHKTTWKIQPPFIITAQKRVTNIFFKNSSFVFLRKNDIYVWDEMWGTKYFLYNQSILTISS